MLHKAQISLLKGFTVVTRIVDDFMRAEKGDKPGCSIAIIMKTLSDSISLLSDASHEIDPRRRTLFRSDTRREHKLLCSDQNPVEGGLLSGTVLGKSFTALSEASKVTSKVTFKQETPHSSSHTFQGRSETRRPFPFLGQDRRTID